MQPWTRARGLLHVVLETSSRGHVGDVGVMGLGFRVLAESGFKKGFR